MAHRPDRPRGGRHAQTFRPEVKEWLFQRFIGSCPHVHDHIRYIRTPGYDEPHLYLDLEGNRMFFRWLATEGLTTPAKAAQMIAAFEAFVESRRLGGP